MEDYVSDLCSEKASCKHESELKTLKNENHKND
jgi:hypothetical protein